MKILKLQKSGFTLIETLVAISILILAVTGAFQAAQKGISLGTFSKNQVVAFYLAGEAIEQIKNIRDENSLKGNSWLQGIANPGDPCTLGTVCMVDAVNAPTLASCNSSSFDACPFLKQSPTGFYGYNSSWTDTIFKRSIKIQSIPSNTDEVSITVHISWTQGLINRSFDIRENILNWH